jgi:hypothetical protein
LHAPAAAKQWLDSMRDLFKFAVKHKLLFVNPAVGIERFGSGNPDGHHCWTHEEVEQFRRRHPIGTKARPALELINALAFRRSDVIAVGPPNVKNGVLKYRQAKFMNISPSDIEVPMPARPVDLMAIIRQTVPTGLQTWLVDGHGKPYTDATFSHWFADRCDEAGLPGKTRPSGEVVRLCTPHPARFAQAVPDGPRRRG